MTLPYVAKLTVKYHNKISLNQYRNVFHYRTTALTTVDLARAADLADQFNVEFTTHLRNAHSDNYQFDTYAVENLEGFVFHEEIIDLAGTITANVLPPASTWAIRLRRSTGTTRDGWKRFSSIPEGQADDAGRLAFIAGQWVTAVNGLVTACETTLDGVTDDYVPIIYRAPRAGLSEGYSDVASAQRQVYVGSQNTRKFGRGI